MPSIALCKFQIGNLFIYVLIDSGNQIHDLTLANQIRNLIVQILYSFSILN